MTSTYPKRLIEVDLPIARISSHARREKSIRHGHISTLHIWWARRPLAACRAVICASLWPDPVDLAEWRLRGEEVSSGSVTIRPERFLAEARTQMAQRIQGYPEKASSESLQRLIAAQKDPARLDDPGELRALLLDFIADFADWNRSTDSDYLGAARALTQAAHEALGGERATKPLVADPFCGGGSIPLEALRVGADAFASDLNPVPVLLNKVVLEYIPKYGRRLADEVRARGKWVEAEAAKELGQFYPKGSDGATTIAYLWARTIISSAPGEGVPVEVPLIRSMWLCKKPGRKWALRWVRNVDGDVETAAVERTYANGVVRTVRQPLMEVFEPQRDADVDGGTSKAGAATCPVTGHTDSVEHVRAQLVERDGGAGDSRLIAVVTSPLSGTGRVYRDPTAGDLLPVELAARRLRTKLGHDPDCVPQEPINHLRGFFNIVLYGMTTWGKAFTPRQLIALTTLVDAVNAARDDLLSGGDEEFADAVQTCLALAVSRHADINASLAMWHQTRELITHVFGRQALPMVWDYAEANSLSSSTGSFMGGIDWVAKVLERDVQGSGRALVASATSIPLPDDSAAAVVTDPPYYAAIPYADLSDFFYCWLKRMLREAEPELMAAQLTPKADECVQLSHRAAMYREKDADWFERKMTLALEECRRVSHPAGVGVFVFANKETAGWEAMLGALVESGWVISASWPVDTELANRLRAQNSAVLASSIHLVCRPRENPDGSLMARVGEWREVLAELPARIEEWMPRLAAEGVVGADAIFACLGPALEVFSRYSRVEKSSGESVALREYLEQVWAQVSRVALSMIFDDPDTAGLEPDARLTAMWLWTLGAGALGAGSAGVDGVDVAGEDAATPTRSVAKSGGYALEFDAARKIAQGLGIHLDRAPSVVQVRGDVARLLSVAERTRYLFGRDGEDGEPPKRHAKADQLDLFVELQEADASVPSPAPELAAPEAGKTSLDRVHQSMILFAAGRGEALKRFLIEDGIGKQANFWKLAQALSALYPMGSDEKRWVDGVLARKKGLGL